MPLIAHTGRMHRRYASNLQRWCTDGLLVGAVLLAGLSVACTSPREGNIGRDRNTTVAPQAFALQPGDFLFQDLDCGPICDAIEAVTTGVNGCDISHIGVAVDRSTVAQHSIAQAKLTHSEADWFVLEALSPAVMLTPLNEFFKRSHDASGHSKVIVGRLLPAYQDLIPAAVDRGLSLLGTPYDERFEMGNEALYCSEMIHDIFKPEAAASPIFTLAPMTFRSLTSGEFLPAWVDYFQHLGIAIPEGQLGINPASISRAPNLRIVHRYGDVSRSIPE